MTVSWYGDHFFVGWPGGQVWITDCTPTLERENEVRVGLATYTWVTYVILCGRFFWSHYRVFLSITASWYGDHFFVGLHGDQVWITDCTPSMERENVVPVGFATYVWVTWVTRCDKYFSVHYRVFLSITVMWSGDHFFVGLHGNQVWITDCTPTLERKNVVRVGLATYVWVT